MPLMAGSMLIRVTTAGSRRWTLWRKWRWSSSAGWVTGQIRRCVRNPGQSVRSSRRLYCWFQGVDGRCSCTDTYLAMLAHLTATLVLETQVRSTAPGFIFTTSIPPMITRGALASVQVLKSSQGRALRARHQERARTLKVRAQLYGRALWITKWMRRLC